MPAKVPVVSERIIESAHMFPQHNSDLRVTVQGAGGVLLNWDMDYSHTLNVLASVVWQQCTGTQLVQRILSTHFETFDATVAQTQSELLDVLVQLQQDGLLPIEKR